MTETCTVVCTTSAQDIWLGSSGSILPGYECKLVSPEGVELTGYDEPGELVVRSPTVVLGYLNNQKATEETFIGDGWMRTGDEAVVRVAPSGNEHVFIVDRIKELIKVKVSLQVHIHPRELLPHTDNHEFRVSKLPQLSLKPIFSPTLPSQIAQSFPCMTTRLANYPRRLS